MNKFYRIPFNVELLEDCHSGSGLGMKGIIDDMQARDSSGKPVVWGTTLKGILRNLAEELYSLNYPVATEKRIIQMFGTEGSDSASNLVFSGLYFDNSNNENLRPVFSTSREIHSRKPLDNTFRCIEMLSAGLTAKCEAQLYGESEDVEFLKLLLKRMVSIGGSRSRGKGRIKITDIDPKEVADYKLETKEWKRIRLLLRTVAPVCLPKASVAGNIIDSESYISGSKLKGALLTMASLVAPDQKEVFTKETLEHSISFGNCYPISEQVFKNEVWKNAEILSVPLTIAAKKSTSVENNLNDNSKKLPWWSIKKSNNTKIPTKDGTVTDKCFYFDTKNNNFLLPFDGNYKRIKEEAYIAIDNDIHHYYEQYQPKMISMLRNRTPVIRSERKVDLRRCGADTKNDEGSLFSTICLSEKEYLLCDIYSDGKNKNWPSILNYIKQNNLWLRLGRGGQPVKIADYLLDYKVQEINKNQDMVILTMTSDFIMRDNTLNFVTSPTKQNFSELFEIDLDKINLFSFTEPVTISGFNSSAKVRLPERLAMKKGSVFVFKGDKSVLDSLYEKLKNIYKSNKGIGEYTDDGFGRFVVNCPVHTGFKSDNTSCTVENDNNIDIEEKLLKKAFDYFESNKKKLIGKDKPTITQWHFFKEKIDCCQNQSDLDNFKILMEQKSEKIGGKCWKSIVVDGLKIFDGFMDTTLDDRLKLFSFIARICCCNSKKNNKN